jgi:hypothetical protein
VQKDYKPLDFHEVCEYKVTQYDPQSGDGGLLVEYINTFVKLKTEASGYPNWVQCTEHKDQYISEFQKGECIQ